MLKAYSTGYNVKKFNKWLAFNIIVMLLRLRYKIEYRGLEKLTPENLSREGGILFLPNHPSETDPLVAGCGIWRKFEQRPVIIEWITWIPVVKSVMKLMRAVPVPDFDQKSSHFKRRQAEQTFDEIVKGLKAKDNFILYPSGRIKRSEKEIIGGASGTHKIIQANPNINIVLVRTTGMWGSIFSWGWDGKRVKFGKSCLEALKVVLKNGIFFVPKKKILVEYEPMNQSFPWTASRHDMNKFLESWYNQKEDPLNLVPYHFLTKKIKRNYEQSYPFIDVKEVPEQIQIHVADEIAKIAKCLSSQVKPEMNLFSDLRLDSLDIQDLVTFLEESYNVKNLIPYHLTTVATAMNYAAHPENVSVDDLTLKSASNHWKNFVNETAEEIKLDGSTLIECFFQKACKKRKDLICADLVSKEVSYEKLMLSAILIAKKIEKIPGQYIGVLLPASVGVNVVTLACYIAKKIPVMINWTVGNKHLEAVIKTTKLEKIITSQKFLKNLLDFDISAISQYIISLERLKEEISLLEKMKASFLVKRSFNYLMNKFDLKNIDPKSPAVILFTSGTEAMPKGVPLSHENILSDMKLALSRVTMTTQDILLGFLPAFHSFGFTVTGLLPIISGIRAVYYPNPTHFKKLAKLIGEWHITLLVGAPTFLKGILQPQQKNLFGTLRIIISGAEKAPASLIKRLSEIAPNALFIEGYGLSECGPILTLNRPHQKSVGVGPPLDTVEILIINPETKEKCAKGATGHVLARGPNVFEGYLGTEIKSPFLEIDGKKWFQTGDLGFLDENNCLTLTGRLKRQVKIGGEIVSLTALEEGLTNQLISEGMINIENESEPSLAVCAKEEAENRAQIYLFITFDLSLEDVNRKIRKLGFSNLYRIKELQKISKLPLMASGKIHYRKLEEDMKK